MPMREAFELRVRGRVQGVGFRPAVWRVANALGLDGEVRNDAEGVLIRLSGASSDVDAFRASLEREPPPLARIDSIAVSDFSGVLARGFAIVESVRGAAHTQISSDARICEACAAEIADPADRRFGYALTNCTHCGPRLSIVQAIPYDRANTTMAPFSMCSACLAEYRDPANRRFHAEPTCCPDCGPRLECAAFDGSFSDNRDAIGAAAELLRAGAIVAIKGLGGYQLACDATHAVSVAALRAAKRREVKPFALMARDMAAIRRYCAVSPGEESQLLSHAAPVVLLAVQGSAALPKEIAPGLGTLGFMLPTTPLHVLLLKDFDTPLVMTSGNASGEPQIIDDHEASELLGGIASHALRHNRAIANRVDDSVVRVMAGAPRLLRRARGYAPSPLPLPEGFEDAPDILALGGELKTTFCLLKDGEAILSQHQGDLEHPAAFDDYRKNLALYAGLFDHEPRAIAADLHPEYLSSKLAKAMQKPVIGVQHHHAHIASCLAENGYPLKERPVLGIALDGLGWGTDGTFWGGEFLLADYCGFRRLACFKPVAMPGGVQAVREPWRNLYAHIYKAFGWDVFCADFPDLEVCAFLNSKPLPTLAAMMIANLNAPPASSCGRLFDAVAAALGLCPGTQSYEGEAATKLESLAAAVEEKDCYPFGLQHDWVSGMWISDSKPMWDVLFSDLAGRVPAARIAARFHNGLAAAIAETAGVLAERENIRGVALSGGCFQNRLLFEHTVRLLNAGGFSVLTQSQVPVNDGGLALGQAAIAAARCLKGQFACA
jgi:hydrogenase maturation protein HypF